MPFNTPNLLIILKCSIVSDVTIKYMMEQHLKDAHLEGLAGFHPIGLRKPRNFYPKQPDDDRSLRPLFHCLVQPRIVHRSLGHEQAVEALRHGESSIVQKCVGHPVRVEILRPKWKRVRTVLKIASGIKCVQLILMPYK